MGVSSVCWSGLYIMVFAWFFLLVVGRHMARVHAPLGQPIVMGCAESGMVRPRNNGAGEVAGYYFYFFCCLVSLLGWRYAVYRF